MNLKIHKLFINLHELVKVIYTIKLRLTKGFPTVYHFHHSDIRFRNYDTKHSLHMNSKDEQYFQRVGHAMGSTCSGFGEIHCPLKFGVKKWLLWHEVQHWDRGKYKCIGWEVPNTYRGKYCTLFVRGRNLLFKCHRFDLQSPQSLAPMLANV